MRLKSSVVRELRLLSSASLDQPHLITMHVVQEYINDQRIIRGSKYIGLSFVIFLMVSMNRLEYMWVWE